MRYQLGSRNGLSRIEVLIAIAIAILIAGILVSLFARIRGAANSQSCRMNLRQFSLAVHNYNDTTGELPMLTDQGNGAVTGRGIRSMWAALIPFLEATPYGFRPDDIPRYNAHSSVAFIYYHKDGTPFIDHGGMVNQAWKVFVDPSDSTAEKLRDIQMTLPDGGVGYYATGSYAANGMLPWGTGGLGRSFPNGPFHTIMFGERPQVCRSESGEVVYNLWGLGFYSPHMPAFATLTPAEAPGMFSTEQIAPAMPFPDEGAADRNSLIQMRIGRRDMEPRSLEIGSPVRSLRRGRPCDPRLPASSHYEGMQVAMVDGSVRVFGYNTDPWVFWAACAPSRGTGDAP